MNYVITPTRDRPSVIPLLEKWISRQTFQDFEWIVVDSGLTPARLTKGQTHLRPPEEVIGMKYNYLQNLMFALDHVKKDPDLGRIFIVEDDDWYAPDCLESMIEERLKWKGCKALGYQANYMIRVANGQWNVIRKGQTMFVMLEKEAIDVLRYSAECAAGLAIASIRRPIMLAKIFYGQLKVYPIRKKIICTDKTVQIKGYPGPRLTRKHDRLGGKRDNARLKMRELLGEEDTEFIVENIRGIPF